MVLGLFFEVLMASGGDAVGLEESGDDVFFDEAIGKKGGAYGLDVFGSEGDAGGEGCGGGLADAEIQEDGAAAGGQEMGQHDVCGEG